MNSHSFPNCCTATILYEMGAGLNVGVGGSVRTVSGLLDQTYDQMRMAKLRNRGMLVCITNSAQKNANKVLKELGWRRGKWCSSRAHPTTKTALWYWPVESELPPLLHFRNNLGLTNQ